MSDSVATTRFQREGAFYQVSTIIRRSSVLGDASRYGETMAWLVTGDDGRGQCVGEWSTLTDDRGRALEMHFDAVRQVMRKGEKDYNEEGVA